MPRKIIKDFDEFIEECKMLPDLNRERVIKPSNSLEAHFLNVADKHGIIDHYYNQLDNEDNYDEM